MSVIFLFEFSSYIVNGGPGSGAGGHIIDINSLATQEPEEHRANCIYRTTEEGYALFELLPFFPLHEIQGSHKIHGSQIPSWAIIPFLRNNPQLFIDYICYKELLGAYYFNMLLIQPTKLVTMLYIVRLTVFFQIIVFF